MDKRLTDENRDYKVIVVNGSYILQQKDANNNWKDMDVKAAHSNLKPGVYRLKEARLPDNKVYDAACVIYSDKEIAITVNKNNLIRHNNEYLNLKLGDLIKIDYSNSNEMPKKIVLGALNKSRSR